MTAWYHLFWANEPQPRFVTQDLLLALRYGRGQRWSLHLEILP